MKHFVTSPAPNNIVHVFEGDDGRWHVFVYNWHHSTHATAVKAVMMLQRLTLARKPQ